MKAGVRWCMLVGGAGLLLGAPARAQDTAPSTTNTPADAVGPRELQNFSLPGTVTRPADQPPTARPAPAPARPVPAARAPSSPPAEARADPTPERRTSPVREAGSDGEERRAQVDRPRAAPAAPPPAPRAASSVTLKLPPVTQSDRQERAADAVPASFTGEASAAPALAPDRSMPLWPWLLAAMALGAGGAFLFLRNRGGPSYAGAAQAQAFAAPDPAPESRAPPPPRRVSPPAAAPPPVTPPAAPPAVAPPATAPAPSPGGIITTRLRPWLDISFKPSRCILEESQVIFEFELDLHNNGSAPALRVLIEANMINASPEQDQQIATFFERAEGEGDRIPSIPSLQHARLKPRVAVPRERLRVLEAAGRQVFVPLIAFNAQYNWGGGRSGQTAAVYLVGRETKTEKLAPLRVDLGPRIIRGLGARPLPNAIRD